MHSPAVITAVCKSNGRVDCTQNRRVNVQLLDYALVELMEAEDPRMVIQVVEEYERSNKLDENDKSRVSELGSAIIRKMAEQYGKDRRCYASSDPILK